MNTYRISKYDPKYRGKDGAYLKHEWTDYSDIGDIFNGEIFTESNYLSVEHNYISCIIDILKKCNNDALCIRRLEKRKTNTWKNGQKISNDLLVLLLCDCLRSNCWCELTGINFFMHFGYDYYIYIGCQLPVSEVKTICKAYDLFCDIKESPYLE